MPSSRSRRITANSCSTSSLVEARGRLVEDQHLRPAMLDGARAMATICWTASE